MFFVRKQKEHQGLNFYLARGSANFWLIEHDYLDSKMVMKTFKKYSEALKFYNSIEKRYEVIKH